MRPIAGASLCLTLLAPGVVLAAPPVESSPPAQRPSGDAPTQPSADAPTAGSQDSPTPSPSPDPGAQARPQAGPETGPATQPDAQPPAQPDPAAPASAKPAAPSGEAATPASSAGPDQPATASPKQPPGADPGTAAPKLDGPSDPTAAPVAAPEGDLSNLLTSDEAAPERRPVVSVGSGDPRRVDRDERLRNYYRSIYRPQSNPGRLYFAARGAYAMSGTTENSGGGRMGFVNAEIGQTWNYVGYGVSAALYGGNMSFGENGTEKRSNVLVGGGPTLSLGRLGLLGKGYIDLRAGYSFFFAPVAANTAGVPDPSDAAPHGPRVQVDIGLLVHGTERRKLRHGLGASLGWQMLAHSLVGEFPLTNTFMVGVGYFFG